MIRLIWIFQIFSVGKMVKLQRSAVLLLIFISHSIFINEQHKATLAPHIMDSLIFILFYFFIQDEFASLPAIVPEGPIAIFGLVSHSFSAQCINTFLKFDLLTHWSNLICSQGSENSKCSIPTGWWNSCASAAWLVAFIEAWGVGDWWDCNVKCLSLLDFLYKKIIFGKVIILIFFSC